MKVLIVYGQMEHWHNFKTDCLLPYFNGKVNAIKIFTNTQLLKNYLNSEGKWHQNYVIPLNEGFLYELRQANITCMMPQTDIVNIFCDKSRFLFYVVMNHLEAYYPKSYINPHPHENKLVIVKPHWGGNSQGCYTANLKDLGAEVFKKNIAQDYIKASREYAGYGVAKHGKIIYSFAYIRDYGDKVYIKGDASDNTTQHRIEMDPNHKVILEKFLMPVKFTGAFCADYKIFNNQLIVFEINARLGGSLAAPYNRNDAAAIISHTIDAYHG